ncbi:hypothetical protein EUX98_g4348 [Antrodiella citrinella]|uniref:Protein kinase domain-containing protein n=1 Tax=Antrodiella citrinella TaxID=2447956 RepID=A0A4S4N261_9APHY|nr:hypothetical protein EUX98_g4348 [Antrodiella citrinella]
MVGLLHHGDNSSVYSGVSKNLDGSQLEVVVKFGNNCARVEREARVYAKLHKLQGFVVPHFYGKLRGAAQGPPSELTDDLERLIADDDDRDSENEIQCLILERFGQPLGMTTEWLKVDREDKACIMDMMADVHACGVVHADFDELNILVNVAPDGNKQYRFIDWDKTVKHKPSCKWQYIFRDHVDDEFRPRGEDACCDHIIREGHSMFLWSYGYLIVPGMLTVAKDMVVPDLPTQDIIDQFQNPYMQLDKIHEYKQEGEITILFFQLVQRRLKEADELGKDFEEALTAVKRDQSYLVYEATNRWYRREYV